MAIMLCGPAALLLPCCRTQQSPEVPSSGDDMSIRVSGAHHTWQEG